MTPPVGSNLESLGLFGDRLRCTVRFVADNRVTTVEMSQMTTTKYPLYFHTKCLVQGSGFIAEADLQGRALVEESEDATWFLGVNPASLSECGADYGTAYLAFRDRLKAILQELACESEDFAAFEAAAKTLLQDTPPRFVNEWGAARRKVREDAALRAALPLRHITAAQPSNATVTLLQTIENECGEEADADSPGLPVDGSTNGNMEFALAA